MAEYIEKEQALQAIKDSELGMEYDAVEIVPAADVQPVVYGYWIQEEDRDFHWHCSECKYTISCGLREFKYCPSCGAKMRAKNEYTD